MKNTFRIPWMKFIRSKPVLALFITECCNLFGLFFFYTNIGKVLTEIHRVPTQYAGYVLAGGFILMPITCVISGRKNKFVKTYHEIDFLLFSYFNKVFLLIVLLDRRLYH